MLLVSTSLLLLDVDFHAAKDGYSLESDILTTLTRESGFEGVMVVRTSAGLKVADHFGNFFRRHTSEIELPAIDCKHRLILVLVNNSQYCCRR